MLNILRHKGVSRKILWVVAIIIILSFGVFGTAYRLDKTINTAGTMYGHNVSIKDFEQAYDDARDAAIMLYGDRFFKLGNRIDLEQEAWNRLVLLKEAQKRNIQTSDQEVVTFIAEIPFFQNQGQFDHFRYETIVQNPQYFNRPVHEFEEGIRKQITIRKLLENVAPDTKISDADLKKEYQKRNEKISLSYVLFNASDDAKNTFVNDDEIKKFYAERKEQFRLPPTLVLNYVQTKQKADADSLSKELTPGADFATVAKKFKLDVKTSSPFTQDQPILTFASNPDNIEKFFAMKQGEYSKPLEDPDGWQIVQVKEKKDSYIPELKDIQSKIKEAIQMQKGFELAKPKADAALKSLQEAIKTKDFKTAATALGLKVEQTPAFGRKEYIANTGLIREFQQETDQLNENNKLSEVVATTQGPAILYLSSKEKPEDGQFESDKENFKQMMAAESRNQILMNFMAQLRIKADIKSKIKRS